MIETQPITTPLEPRPITGWPLHKLICIDEACAGFLRRCLLASDLRRQGVYLALARLDLERPQDLAERLLPLAGPESDVSHPLRVIAQVLLTARVRDVIRCLSAPGLFGALTRSSGEALRSSDYDALAMMHQDERYAPHVEVLRHLRKVTSVTIDILEVLKPPFVVLPVVKRLHHREQAEQLMAGIDLIHRVIPDVSDDELLQSLMAMTDVTCLSRWLKGWLSRAQTFLICAPMPDDEELVGLHSGEALSDASRRYKNCLESKIVECALGHSYFLEYRPQPTIVELVSLDRGYLLDGLYGPNNQSPDAATVRAIRRKLEQAGVFMPARLAHAKPYNRVARLVGGFFWNTGNLDDDAPEELAEEIMDA